MLNQLFMGPMLTQITAHLCIQNAFYPKRMEKTVPRRLRVLVAAVMVVLTCTIDYFAVNTDNASTAIQPMLCVAVGWMYAALVLRMDPGKAFYCTVWSHLLSELLTQQLFLHVLFRMPRMEEWAVFSIKMALMLAMAVGAAWVLRKTLVRHLFHDGDYLINRRKVLLVASVLAMQMLLTNYQLIFWLMGGSSQESHNMVLVFRLIIDLFAVVILFLQNDIEKRQQALQELEVLNQMWHRQQEHLRLSRENIDIINRKCHDLKHQIAALRTLKDRDQIDRQIAEMEEAVMIYDSVIRTGNPVLDVVLTEKSLYCEVHQINMTCLVDGKQLDFVDSVDLYTLFGNALDNAIESVMKQTDKQKRVIQVAAYEEQGMLLIRIRNYCDDAPELVDGLPVTTKADADYHGFGLKSIRHTAEKYGGGISIQTGSNFFSLQILLPLKQEG